MRRVLFIGWPAFLAASVLMLPVFAVVDPLDLHWAGEALMWSREAVYTAGFFLFWCTTASACGLSTWLCRPARGWAGNTGVGEDC